MTRLTAGERQVAAAALRHYPNELVELAASGESERAMLAAGFSQYQVSAVRALLAKIGTLPRTASAA